MEFGTAQLTPRRSPAHKDIKKHFSEMKMFRDVLVFIGRGGRVDCDGT